MFLNQKDPKLTYFFSILIVAFFIQLNLYDFFKQLEHGAGILSSPIPNVLCELYEKYVRKLFLASFS